MWNILLLYRLGNIQASLCNMTRGAADDVKYRVKIHQEQRAHYVHYMCIYVELALRIYRASPRIYYWIVWGTPTTTTRTCASTSCSTAVGLSKKEVWMPAAPLLKVPVGSDRLSCVVLLVAAPRFPLLLSSFWLTPRKIVDENAM